MNNIENKLKWSVFTLVFLFASALWFFFLAVGEIHGVKAWFFLVFFTLLTLLFLFVLVKIFKGYKVVEFTDEYLVIFDFFGRKTLVPWNKIESFSAWRTGYQNQIKVITSDIEKTIAEMPTAFRRFTARLNYKTTGAIYFIMEDLGGRKMEDLLKECNTELKKRKNKHK